MTMRHLLALPVAGALLLGGCAGAGTTIADTPRQADRTPAAIASAPAGARLASRTLSGGMCADGPCGSGLSVRVDGRYEAWDRADQFTGRLDAAALRSLVEALPETHLHVTKKSIGSCPSVSDALDLTIGYLDPDTGRQVRVSSCDYTFGDDALVSTLARLQEQVTSDRLPRR